MTALEKLSARVNDLLSENVKALAAPDAETGAIDYLRGTLGALMLIQTWLETYADADGVSDADGDNGTEAAS